MKFKVFAILTVFLVVSSLEGKPGCYHEKLLKAKPASTSSKLKLSQFERFHRVRTLKERPIQIIFDYKPTTDPNLNLVKEALEISKDFLSKRLNVLYSNQPFIASEPTCSGQSYDESHTTTGFTEDLLIIVVIKNEESTSLAAAVHCELHPTTNRPITGYIEFQSKNINTDPNQFSELVDTAIHEIIHILGFNSDLFPEFISGFRNPNLLGLKNIVRNVTFKGVQGQALITNKVLKVAREHFNCSSIQFVPLENNGDEGSKGSHWERLALNNEMLCASDTILDVSLSDFTLAVLEDSGWYRVNYKYSEPLIFGKSAGCQFFNEVCSPQKNPEEFCSQEIQTCAVGRRGKAECTVDDYSNNCLLTLEKFTDTCEFAGNVPQTNNKGEVFGLGSRCLKGRVDLKGKVQPRSLVPLCYKIQCQKNGADIILSDGSKVFCGNTEKGNKRISGNSLYSGEIECPNVGKLCNTSNVFCPNFCSNKGVCVKGVCECSAGSTGDDCSSSI